MASSKPQASAASPKTELPVLIIGAGLAGLTVALHMAETQPVIVMAKRGLGEAATAWAQGGIVGVVDKEHDSVDSHVSDTLDAGAGLVVESTARYIAEESAEAIRWLVEQGVPFTVCISHVKVVIVNVVLRTWLMQLAKPFMRYCSIRQEPIKIFNC
jgi:L-aspartate oxidase